MDRLDQIVVQLAVRKKGAHRVLLGLDLGDKLVQMLGDTFQFGNQIVGIPDNHVRVGKEVVDRRLDAIYQVTHLESYLVQAGQALLELGVRGVHKFHQAVFQSFRLHQQGVEPVLEILAGNSALQGPLHRFQQDLGAVANFACQTEGLGDTGVELTRNGVARLKILLGVPENHANLAFAHDTDVLDTDFGILGDHHVGAEAYSHHHAVACKLDTFHLAQLDAIDLNRVVKYQGTDLGKPQVEGVESLSRVLLVQEEHAENQDDDSQQDDKTDREVKCGILLHFCLKIAFSMDFAGEFLQNGVLFHLFTSNYPSTRTMGLLFSMPFTCRSR